MELHFLKFITKLDWLTAARIQLKTQLVLVQTAIENSTLEFSKIDLAEIINSIILAL